VVDKNKCYLCDHDDIEKVNGRCRDNHDLLIFKCLNCNLEYLENFDHIDETFYEKYSHKTHNNMSDNSKIFDKWCTSTRKDDLRRFKHLARSVKDKNVMDFGAGNCGFLKLCSGSATSLTAIELDNLSKNMLKDSGISFFKRLEDVPKDKKFDIITMFHVLEHLKDPISCLRQISSFMNEGTRLFLEIPNANDALLKLYNNDEYSKFIYWSYHLRIFNQHNIKILIEKAGLSCLNISQIQRYPLSNHLYWLSHNKPGGQEIFKDLNNLGLESQYSTALARMGMCDTILVEVKK